MKNFSTKHFTLSILLIIIFPVLDACEGNEPGSCEEGTITYFDYDEVDFTISNDEDDAEYIYFNVSPSAVEFLSQSKSSNSKFGAALMAVDLRLASQHDIDAMSIIKYANNDKSDAVDVSNEFQRYEYSKGWIALSDIAFDENHASIRLRCPLSTAPTLQVLEMSIEKSNGALVKGYLHNVSL